MRGQLPVVNLAKGLLIDLVSVLDVLLFLKGLEGVVDFSADLAHVR